MTDNEKRIALGAWNAGWAAACFHIAAEIERHGGSDLAPFFRDIANRPDPVVIGEGKTPPGQEILMMQEFPKRQR